MNWTENKKKYLTIIGTVLLLVLVVVFTGNIVKENTKKPEYDGPKVEQQAVPQKSTEMGEGATLIFFKVVDASGKTVATYGVNQTSITLTVSGNMTIETTYANKKGWSGNY